MTARINTTKPAGKIPVMKQVAILGAGVMGAQIAAHFANAGVPSLLFDLPASEGSDASATARAAIRALSKQKPEPLALGSFQQLITPCNYDDDLNKLNRCDLVIEVIAERADWKIDLYKKITPHLNENTTLASNTSGISIELLAEGVPDSYKDQFLGIHFFNPPRYMPLVEIIAHNDTRSDVLDDVETFLISTLGKGVVRAKDTTNFIANRVGIFSILVTLYHAERLGINFESVDALTGTKLGRPKSATLRTADVVGLDTMRHVIQGVIDNLGDDPWADLFKIPAWLDRLVDKGSLGQKTKIGIYKKEGKEILVLDTDTGNYRKRKVKIPRKVEKILKAFTDPDRLANLRDIKDPNAEFLWAIHRDVLHYCAYFLEDIADNARDIDMAIRWGFGWKQGPFEIWQHSGWDKLSKLIKEDIDSGKTHCDLPLPDWVSEIDAIHNEQGSWSAKDHQYKAPSTLPVYDRQRWPETVVGAKAPEFSVLFENDVCKFWITGGENIHDDIGVLSFKTKLHTISDAVLSSINEAIDLAEEQLTGMVIWHPDAPFSAGADLKSFMPIAMKSILPGNNGLDELLQRFQNTCIRMRKSNVPVVAGVQGLALGGGCELMMQTDRVVAALESYIGLVEVGVGLIPAGSGCMEFARRASVASKGEDVFDHIKNAFETIGMGKVATSAYQAKDMGFLRETDIVVMNKNEVLHTAIAQVRALNAANYRPQPEQTIRAGGRAAIANIKAAMVNMHAGGFISDYDMKIGELVADALCGGNVDEGTELTEEWFLRYEREGFRKLLKNPKTHMRVKHMLDTGKPLRN